MKNIEFKYPALFQFFGGYFYQGWILDYRWENSQPDFAAVVRHFKAVNPQATVMRVSNELEDLIRADYLEGELEKILSKLGSNFYAQAENLQYSEWLFKILEILSESQTKARVLRELA